MMTALARGRAPAGRGFKSNEGAGSDDAAFASGVTTVADFSQQDVTNPGLKAQKLDVGGKSAKYVRITATRLAPRLPSDFIFAIAELEALDAAGKNVAAGGSVTSLDSIEAPPRWRRTNLVDGLYPGANIATAERLVREAAKRGAQIILIQELFETPYFCIEQDSRHLRVATTVAENRAIRHFTPIARELGVVLPISFFEKANNAYFNSIAILDADGTNLGVYRKAHIPNGPGYQEKNYFSPGDTGFMVFDTRFARIGVAICWDQWFPECARAMALKGAEMLFYPTAIGSEPPPALPVNSRDHWQRTQQGHAAANLMPVVVSNRIGTERALQDPDNVFIRFYGSSFIADATGAKVAEADEEEETVITAKFDLERIAELRNNWFVFRDRRPELYGVLTTYDGGNS